LLNKQAKIYSAIIIAIIGLLVFLETSQKAPINWFPSFMNSDKIPLGTYVVFNSLKDSYTDQEIREINQPPYEFLSSDDTVQGTYFFVNNSIAFDESELNKILDWVDNGNQVFISSKQFSQKLLDTLSLEMNNLVALNNINTKPEVALANPRLNPNTFYTYDRNTYIPYFSKIDTVNAVALGTARLAIDSLQTNTAKLNYILYPFGKGEILLHTQPEVLSNYFVLKDQNHEYTERLLAYVNTENPILWDNYYKSGKKIQTSPLYLILNNRHLRWSYYFILIGTVLFIIFEGRRKQRSIPIITPLKNQTLAFTQTISGMYFEKQKHKEIAKKQYLLFLDYIRQQLRISTQEINEKTLEDIAARSTNSLEKTKTLFKYLEKLNNQQQVSADELLRLNRLIYEFKYPLGISTTEKIEQQNTN